jgi:hypothetical protein
MTCGECLRRVNAVYKGAQNCASSGTYHLAPKLGIWGSSQQMPSLEILHEIPCLQRTLTLLDKRR